MTYASLRDFIDRLETTDRLVRVATPVATALEMTEIQTRLLAEGGPAVLFETPVRPDGSVSKIPVLANLFGTVWNNSMVSSVDDRHCDPESVNRQSLVVALRRFSFPAC